MPAPFNLEPYFYKPAIIKPLSSHLLPLTILFFLFTYIFLPHIIYESPNWYEILTLCTLFLFFFLVLNIFLILIFSKNFFSIYFNTTKKIRDARFLITAHFKSIILLLLISSALSGFLLSHFFLDWKEGIQQYTGQCFVMHRHSRHSSYHMFLTQSSSELSNSPEVKISWRAYDKLASGEKKANYASPCNQEISLKYFSHLQVPWEIKTNPKFKFW